MFKFKSYRQHNGSDGEEIDTVFGRKIFKKHTDLCSIKKT